MKIQNPKRGRAHLANVAFLLIAMVAPGLAFAGTPASPFATGTTGFSPALLAILTPFAVVGFMASGVGALTGKIPWSWFVGVIIGIVMIFGAPQLVVWIRALFGV